MTIHSTHVNSQTTMLRRYWSFIYKAKSNVTPHKETNVAQSPTVHVSTSFRTSVASRGNAGMSPRLTPHHPPAPRSSADHTARKH